MFTILKRVDSFYSFFEGRFFIEYEDGRVYYNKVFSSKDPTRMWGAKIIKSTNELGNFLKYETN